MTITLEPAGQIHAALMSQMHQICFTDSWSEANFATTLASPDTSALIAVANQSWQPSMGDQGPAGMVVWRIVADEAEILSIAVLPPWRQRGLGVQLLEAAISAIKQIGITYLFLEVAVNNPAGQALYAKLGFIKVGLRKEYYQGTDAFVMRKDL